MIIIERPGSVATCVHELPLFKVESRMSTPDSNNDPWALLSRMTNGYKALEEELQRVRRELADAYSLLAATDAGRINEISQTYGMLREVDADRAAVTSRLNEALLELGPARFNSKHFETLKREKRLIELDFAVNAERRDFGGSPHMRRLVASMKSKQADFKNILNGFSRFASNFAEISSSPPDDSMEPHWRNNWLPGLDGVSLYSFVAERRPKLFFEVGSGNSTLFVRRAINDHALSTKIISIDPYPRADIDRICDEVHRVGVECLDLAIMERLSPGDVVFIDNSHRSFQNSDVTVFFMEMLGRLPKGCLYGIHDIFLPDDYPDGWQPRFYNEQFLLASYLFGGADGDDIVFPAAFISNDIMFKPALDEFWRGTGVTDVAPFGGAFWLTKG